MDKSINMADDHGFSQRLEKVMHGGELLAMMGMATCVGDKGAGPKALVLGITAVAGSLSVLADFLTKKDDQTTDDHLLLAALLVASAISYGKDPSDPSKQGVLVNYLPTTIVDAMTAMEKLTGIKMDSQVHDNLAKAGREVAAEAGDPLKSFMDARAANSKPA